MVIVLVTVRNLGARLSIKGSTHRRRGVGSMFRALVESRGSAIRRDASVLPIQTMLLPIFVPLLLIPLIEVFRLQRNLIPDDGGL